MTPPVHTARRRFGQHFLHDPRVLARIVAAIAPARDDVMVEIGAGRGALTTPLVAALSHLHVVEIDRDLVEWLRSAFAPSELTVHAADALAFDYASLVTPPTRLRVVGNLPYNVSSPILFRLLAQVRAIQDMHFMLQREVVERMAAEPGGRTYGRLSVMVQLHCAVEVLFSVGPGAFRPPPKVDSSVARLTPHPQLPDDALVARVATIAARAFAQRRKTLRNALRGLTDAQQLAALGLDPALRPERLAVADFVRIAEHTLGSQPGCG